MVRSGSLLILGLVGLAGCVSHSESTTTAKAIEQLARSQTRLAEAVSREKSPEVHVAPIDWKPLLEQLRAKATVSDQASSDSPGLYTGALVHLDARVGRCAPCENLKHDLAQLARDTAWAVGPRGNVHWRLILHANPDFAVPRIDFVIDGQVVRTVEGYAGPPSRTGYRGPLHLLINQHPSVAKAVK